MQSADSALVTAVESSLMFKETAWCPLLDPEISAMIDEAEKWDSNKVADFLRLSSDFCSFPGLFQNPDKTGAIYRTPKVRNGNRERGREKIDQFTFVFWWIWGLL